VVSLFLPVQTAMGAKLRSGKKADEGANNDDDRIGASSVNDDFRAHKDWRTKLLCLTSATMLFPLTLQNCWGLTTWQSTFMSWWCVVTWGVSVLYWHDARPGWRLDLDNFFAKFSFCVVVYFGATYGSDMGSSIFGWLVGVAIVVLYLQSCHLFSAKNSNWIFPHGLMHICVGSNMAVCVWTGHRNIVSPEAMGVCGLQPIDHFFHALAHMANAVINPSPRLHS